MIRLPGDFVRRIVDVHGEVGKSWVARLPRLLDELSARWQLQVGEPYELSYNVVLRANRLDGPSVVLKVAVPGPAFWRELDALVWFDGQGSVRLLESDREQGAMLLERLTPGHVLSTLEDEDAETAIAADVMASLWKPAPREHRFPTTDQLANELGNLRRAFSGGTGPFPRELVERAESLFVELFEDAVPSVVLHSDLHHNNIPKEWSVSQGTKSALFCAIRCHGCSRPHALGT
jgi:streptomycin 6-kinase